MSSSSSVAAESDGDTSDGAQSASTASVSAASASASADTAPASTASVSTASASAASAQKPAATKPARRPAAITRWWRGLSYNAESWIVTLLVTLFGGLLRFIRLGTPHALVFDESYYVKDAWSLLRTGTEHAWTTTGTSIDAQYPSRKFDDLFASGQVDTWLEAIHPPAHPPLGRWLIAFGMWLCGGATNSFAWRFSVAVAGTVAILLMVRVALHLFHNLTIAALAGVFMSVDGLAIVMSRTSMLDIFIMTFTLGALLCLLNHRDWALRKLRAAHERDVARPGSVIKVERLTLGERRGEGGCEYADPSGRPVVRLVVNSRGPQVTFSWWRLGMVFLLGLATGVKWSGLWFMAVFSVLSVLLDAYNRRQVGYRSWFTSAIVNDGIVTALWSLPAYAVSYLLCWSYWFIYPYAAGRQWAQYHEGDSLSVQLPEPIESFILYHRSLWEFHTAESPRHVYHSWAFAWPLQIQPTRFIIRGEADRSSGLCPVDTTTSCMREVLALGNPILWWVATACLVIGLCVAIAHRRGDWRFWVVCAPLFAAWLPWIPTENRSVFNYYAVAFLPAMILAVCYVLDWLRREHSRRVYGWTARIVTAAVVIAGVYFYPLWTAIPVPMSLWRSYMWFSTWV